MKRVNPIALRLGFSSPWFTDNVFLNYSKTILFQVTLHKWFFSIFNIWSRISLFHKVFLFGVNSKSYFSMLFIFLRGCFFFFSKSKGFYFRGAFKRKKRYFRLFNFVLFFFLNMERFLSKLFSVKFVLQWRNLYSLHFYNRFIRFFELSKRRFRFLNRPKLLFFFSYLILALYYRDVSFLANLMSFFLKGTKQHNKFLYFFSNIFRFLFRYFPRFGNLTLRISGRINGHSRSKSRWFIFGRNINFQTYKKPLLYSSSSAITPSGNLGIQLWLQQ